MAALGVSQMISWVICLVIMQLIMEPMVSAFSCFFGSSFTVVQNCGGDIYNLMLKSGQYNFKIHLFKSNSFQIVLKR